VGFGNVKLGELYLEVFFYLYATHIVGFGYRMTASGWLNTGERNDESELKLLRCTIAVKCILLTSMICNP